MGTSIVPSLMRRLIVGTGAAMLSLAVASGSVAANEPADWLLPEDGADLRAETTAADSATAEPTEPASRPATTPPAPTPSRTPDPTPTPTSTAEPAAPEPMGYDVSYPQCRRPLPEPADFAIVGVNGGRVFSLNPCFGQGRVPGQLEWAGEDAELYFNTGNPGPRLSRFWPHGETEPRACDTRDVPGDDTVECSFVYGWNAAEFAYSAAVDAFVELGWIEDDAEHLPETTAIWLDVEPANSWRRNRELNVAALEGAVAYLESMEVERIGFYSTPRLWSRITGGTERFADHPAWHAGARDRADAEVRCQSEAAFTGGELAMVQWVEQGLDHNLRCEDLDAAP